MAPTFRHGSGTRILVNEYNMGSVLNDSGVSNSVDKADKSVYGDQTKGYLVGLADAVVKYTGLYDGNASTAGGIGAKARIHEVLTNLVGTTGQAVNTYGPEGDAIGRRARLFAGVVDQFDLKTPQSDVVAIEVSQAMASNMDVGEWLKDFTTPVTAAPTTFAIVDGVKASTVGGSVHAHVIGWVSTGTWTWKVQHSSAAVYTDLTTARVLNAATRYQRVVLTGAIKKNVKAILTAKTGGNANIGIAYGRDY